MAYDPNYFTSGQNLKDNPYGGEELYNTGGNNIFNQGWNWLSSKLPSGQDITDAYGESEGTGSILAGTKSEDEISTTGLPEQKEFNPVYTSENTSITYPSVGAVKNMQNNVTTGKDITLATINNEFNGDNDTIDNVATSERKRPFRSLFDKMRMNRQARQAERQKRRDARPERGRAGFRNIGSAQFDEQAFFNEGQENEEVNLNYGKLARHPVGHEKAGEIINKGKGLFGKEGGFGSAFGTGRGLLGTIGKDMGGRIGQDLVGMGEDMMYGGGYEYGNFYDRGDE